MTHYSAYDNKGACLREAPTWNELLAGFIHDGEGDLKPMPDVAKIEVSIDDLDNPVELPAFMVKNFNIELEQGCEWDDGAYDRYQDAKGKAQYYHEKYGDAL